MMILTNKTFAQALFKWKLVLNKVLKGNNVSYGSHLVWSVKMETFRLCDQFDKDG